MRGPKKEYMWVGRRILVDLAPIGCPADWRTAVIDDVYNNRWGEVVMKASTTDGRTRFTYPAGTPSWNFIS